MESCNDVAVHCVTEWAIRYSNPRITKTFCSSTELPDQTWSPPTLLLLLGGWRGLFKGLKRPRREVDHSPPSSAETKNQWSWATHLSVLCLYGVDRDIFYLLPWNYIWQGCTYPGLLNFVPWCPILTTYAQKYVSFFIQRAESDTEQWCSWAT